MPPVELTNTFSLFSVQPPSDEWNIAFATPEPRRSTVPAVALMAVVVAAASPRWPR